MSKLLEECRVQFIKDNDYYDKVYLNESEQEKLNRQIIEDNFKDSNPFEDYYYDETEDGLYKFYEKKPKEVPDAELNQYISLKMLELNKSMNEKQNTIRGILIFWLVLSILSLLITLYTLSR